MDNQSFLLGFGSVLKDAKSFSNLCEENGMILTKNYLPFYEQEGFLRPIAIDNDASFYSPFQIYRIYLLEHCIEYSLRNVRFSANKKGTLIQRSPIKIKRILDVNRDTFLHRDEEFYKLISFLHHAEPFYSESFSVTDYLVNMGFDLHSPDNDKWIRDKKKSGIGLELMELHSIDVDSLRWWQSNISMNAHNIDPLANWYHLPRNFGRQDKQKIKRLKGHATLAQTLYRMEEILRRVILDVAKEKIMNPLDITDGRGGSWRIARDEKGEEVACSVCHVKPVWLKTLHAQHQKDITCSDCTIDFFQALDAAASKKDSAIHSSDPHGIRKEQKPSPPQTPLLCDNEKCRKILLKGLNEATIIDDTQSALLAIEVYYGEFLLRIKCKSCGSVTARDISIGWDTSPGA